MQSISSLFMLLLLLSGIFPLTAQNLLLGAKGGPNYAHVTAVLTIDGTEEEKLKDVGSARGLPGFHAGAYLNYKVRKGLIGLNGPNELITEQLRAFQLHVGVPLWKW